MKFNNKTDTEEAIQAANRPYLMNSKLFRTKLLSRNVKLRLYKTLIRPVLSNGYEVRKFKAYQLQQIEAFERKILRKLFGPVQVDIGEYRSRYNHELNDLINGHNIRFIKAQRIKWLGHIIRMPETSTVRRVLEAKPGGKRRRGRPRKRWLDAVEDDLGLMRVTSYRTTVLNRDI